MKSVILVLLLATLTQPDQSDPTLANVRKVSGIPVFLYSEPVRPYNVIEDKTFMIFSDCNELVQSPMKRARAMKADGVIVDMEGGRYQLIKWN
jgi:hypothetical protein